MRAVILAAGFGSRLRAAVPKCLIRFSSGRCLLDYQLAELSRVMEPHRVHIVVGFRKELVLDAAPGCTFVYNERFDRTNTARSLLRAVERLDDDVLWMNGDVYADPGMITRVAAAEGNVVLADTARVADEEVCYTTGADGTIRRLAKGLAGAEGEALGINKVTRAALPALAAELRRVADQDYFEAAM